MMAAMSGGGDEPLYRFHDFQRYGANGNGYVFCSNGNHFIVHPYNATFIYFDFETIGTTQSNGKPSPISKMFDLNAGDLVEAWAKNIQYSSSGADDQLLFMLRSNSDAYVGGLGSSAHLIFPQGTGTFEDTVYRSTRTTDADAFYIRANRDGNKPYNLTVEFDFEVYVNGVRYI